MTGSGTPSRVVLMRHGTAADRLAEGSDHERPLTAHGVQEALWTAEQIRDVGWSIDRVFHSDAHRTSETWWAVQSVFPGLQATASEHLYRAGPDDLLQAIERERARGGCVLWVGHNPTWSQVASFLVGDQRAMRPATAACIALPVPLRESGAGRLEHWFVPPSERVP